MLKSGQIVFNKQNSVNKKPLSNLQQPVNQNLEYPEEKMKKVAEKTNEPIFSAKTFFPLDIAPDEITIDRNKVHIIHKELLGSADIHTIPIDEISEVIVETNNIFSTLKILEVHTREISKVTQLKAHEAQKLKNVIEGLITARKNNIDLDQIDTTLLSEKLEKLGQGSV